MIDLKKALSIAQQAVRRAGDYQLECFTKAHTVWEKNPHDINIAEDLESDKLIIEVLSKNFPEHQILSEESGYSGKKDSDYLWIVDPLDGTTNFSLSVPLFCSQLALSYKEEIVLSVIYIPTLDNMIWSSKGQNTYNDGKKLSVSGNTNIRNSVIALERGKALKNIIWLGKFLPKVAENCRTYRNYNCVGWDMFLIAKGAIDGCVICGAALHDVAPGVLAIKQAGGIVTDELGKPWKFGSRFFLAANDKIHEELLKLINKDYL